MVIFIPYQYSLRVTNLNKRITKKKASRSNGLTKPQLNRIRQLMPSEKYKQFTTKWFWWDYAYIIDLLYYVDPDKGKGFLAKLDDIEDEFDGIGHINPSDSVETIKYKLYKLQKPYFDLVRGLTPSQAYLYGLILECCARAYNAHGAAVDSPKVAKELIKASGLLKHNKVDEYINYASEDSRLQGWWD